MKRLFLFPLLAVLAFAQSFVTPTLTGGAGPSSAVLQLSSVTGISAGFEMYVDREAMLVIAVGSGSVTVQRGYDGTGAADHASGAAVTAGPKSLFSYGDLTGTGCTSRANVGDQILSVRTGSLWRCTSTGAWTAVAGASYPGVTSDGANGLNVVGNVAIGGTVLRGGGILLPATCAVGEQFFLTTGTTGNYQCTALNTWTLPGGGIGATPYTCTATSVTSVTCTHNLGTATPWVACYDGSGNMLGSSGAATSVTSVVATSTTVATLTFSGTTTATCQISTGAMGPAGTNGTNGTAATVAVGTVTTGAAGSSATVTNSGTSLAATLNFTIPKGDTGAPGSGHSFGGVFDGSGANLTASTTTAAYMVMPYACTLQSWDILVDAGTVTFKVWRVASGTALPTVSNSISTSGISLASGTALHSTTLTDFTTTTINANDIIGVNLAAVSGVKVARLQVQCQ